MRNAIVILVGIMISACNTSQVDQLHRAAFTAVSPQQVGTNQQESATPSPTVAAPTSTPDTGGARSACDNKPKIDGRGRLVTIPWQVLTTNGLTIAEFEDGARLRARRLGLAVILTGIDGEGISIDLMKIDFPPRIPEVITANGSLQYGQAQMNVTISFWWCGNELWMSAGPTDLQPQPTPTFPRA